LVDQREVGVDTESYEIALKNTLRQAPNVILIGEVRDRETMQSVINFAETGHLCSDHLARQHHGSGVRPHPQLLPRRAAHQQVLMDSVVQHESVRFAAPAAARKTAVGLVPAVEILLNTPLMAELDLSGHGSRRSSP
jgi:twitching motility protein PilU